ncbi:MAG: rRNA pseudouridine synthase [Coriobacteriia bacterium]|nr:rRNA pseudouridine synthase [Coriobacteriia bacterium]
MRLQRFIARAGVASRRGSENLMTSGRVTVNGEVVTELGSKVSPEIDEVAVDGIVVTLNDESVYLILNKPKGYVSTMNDPHARHTVAELVPTEEYPGLFPVGRLDADTTGLMLFTTDGDLSHRVLHPKYQVYKQYRAQVERALRDAELQWLRDGVMLEDGLTAPALVERIETRRSGEKVTDVLTVSIREGRKRQIRRMFDTIGHPVIELERISLGTVELGDLQQSAWRMLSDDEKESL